MAMYKQIQVKFWQNDFVLGLAPEERYFYMYLITNTMTTLCGIYRFNIRLAELETGLSGQVIKNYLDTFESRRKIIVSKATKEIMIVNWLKHNFKMNKKTISSINAELKDVKDKELLRQFYEICQQRQYPTEEIFKGIILSLEVKEEAGSTVKDMQGHESQVHNGGQATRHDPEQNTEQAMPQSSRQEITQARQQVPEQSEKQAMPQNSGSETAQAIHEKPGADIGQAIRPSSFQNTAPEAEKQLPLSKTTVTVLSAVDRQNTAVPESTPSSQASWEQAKETKGSPEMLLFMGPKGASNSGRKKKRKGKRYEEIEAEMTVEEEQEEGIKWDTIAEWSF